MKKILIVFISILFAACSAEKPLADFETTSDVVVLDTLLKEQMNFTLDEIKEKDNLKSLDYHHEDGSKLTITYTSNDTLSSIKVTKEGKEKKAYSAYNKIVSQSYLDVFNKLEEDEAMRMYHSYQTNITFENTLYGTCHTSYKDGIFSLAFDH